MPRLRQRLVGVPFGGGRPIWVDHNAFDIAEHVRSVRCPEPGDERALLDAAAALTDLCPDQYQKVKRQAAGNI